MRVTNWTARPSGGAITVDGTGPDGQPVKLRGVRRLETTRAWWGGVSTTCVDASGTSHVLA